MLDFDNIVMIQGKKKKNHGRHLNGTQEQKHFDLLIAPVKWNATRFVRKRTQNFGS